MTQARGRIAIYSPSSSLNVNPHTLALVNALENAGCRVDVFSAFRHDNAGQIPEQCKGRVFLFPQFDEIPFCIADYSCIIGIDSGIVQAAGHAGLLGIAHGFISYEMAFDDELKGHPEWRQFIELKHGMKKACEGLAFAVSQDALRGGHLCREYGINPAKLIYMPVAGDMVVPFAPQHFLHEQLGISPATDILLHMGSVADWTCVDIAVQRAAFLPDNWVLVIHDRFGESRQLAVPAAAGGKVLFSTAAQDSPEGLRALIQSARCCLGFYRATGACPHSGKNIGDIGLSSGKIGMALQHGVPVLLNEIGAVSHLVREHGAGIVVDMDDQTCFSQLDLLPPPQEAARACHALFENALSLNRSFPALLERLDALHRPFSLRPLLAIDFAVRTPDAIKQECYGMLGKHFGQLNFQQCVSYAGAIILRVCTLLANRVVRGLRCR